jgi:DNA-binding GntR family transcriptional regulator
MDFKVTVTSVQAQLVHKLREAIFTGVFAPGEKLSEPSLCRLFGVSRTSVREALRSLSAEKLVTIIPHRGPMVSQISWAEAEAIYDVRALLEGEALALFTQRAQPEDLQELRVALGSFGDAVLAGDAMLRVSSTTRFYNIIFGRCGNPLIAEIVEGLTARINFLRSRSMSVEHRSFDSLKEMAAILGAVEERDPAKAREAAVAHVMAARAAAERAFASI